MQTDGGVVAAVGQELADIVHMGSRLVLWRQLFERDEGRCQRFDDDPFVVTRDSLSRHPLTLCLIAPFSRRLACRSARTLIALGRLRRVSPGLVAPFGRRPLTP